MDFYIFFSSFFINRTTSPYRRGCDVILRVRIPSCDVTDVDDDDVPLVERRGDVIWDELLFCCCCCEADGGAVILKQ